MSAFAGGTGPVGEWVIGDPVTGRERSTNTDETTPSARRPRGQRGHHRGGLFVGRGRARPERGRQRRAEPRQRRRRRQRGAERRRRARVPGRDHLLEHPTRHRERRAPEAGRPPGRPSTRASPSRRTSSRSMVPTRSTQTPPTPALQPDILRADIGWTPTFADAGMLLDLTQLLPGRLPGAIPAGPDGDGALQGRDVRRSAGDRRARSPVQQERDDGGRPVGRPDHAGTSSSAPAPR